MMQASPSDETGEARVGGPKRTRMVRPYPTHSLEDAIAVAAAIHESNAGLPFERRLLARALGTTPASSGYTMRLNSSAKYGLTQGGYNDDFIKLTPRGESIVAPKDGTELRAALVEASMVPEVFDRFYRLLDGKRVPEDTYAQNMLHRELGIQPELAAECLSIIKANGLYAGLVRTADEALYVDLKGARDLALQDVGEERYRSGEPAAQPAGRFGPADVTSRREQIYTVYIGSAEIAETVLRFLDEFEIPHTATVDADESDIQPVPAAVSRDMRSCTAAVLVLAHADGLDSESADRPMERMLFQLGAASVLYGDRIVVVREVGLNLPADISGLRLVEFDRAKPEQAGLSLLRELRRAGVISMVV